MHRFRVDVLFLALLFTMTGCYHARITTGEQPGTQVIEQPFANGWIYGIVPPPVVETEQQCPEGVARVETQLSFLNLAVSAATLGIYTPVTIRVTCASGATSSVLPTPEVGFESITISRQATEASVNETFQRAVLKAARTNQPVAVRFVRGFQLLDVTQAAS